MDEIITELNKSKKGYIIYKKIDSKIDKTLIYYRLRDYNKYNNIDSLKAINKNFNNYLSINI